jgi:hypothetical protein
LEAAALDCYFINKMFLTLRATIRRRNAAIWCRAVDLCGEGGNLHRDSFNANGAKSASESALWPFATFAAVAVKQNVAGRGPVATRRTFKPSESHNKNLSQHDRAA